MVVVKLAMRIKRKSARHGEKIAISVAGEITLLNSAWDPTTKDHRQATRRDQGVDPVLDLILDIILQIGRMQKQGKFLRRAQWL